MDPFWKAKNVMKKVVETNNWKLASELLQDLLQHEELQQFKKSPSPFVQLDDVFDDVAKLTVFIMSLHPPIPNAEILADSISFYDVAEGLMSMYVFGKFDVRYMPRAHQLQQRGERISLRKTKRLLEEVGIVKGGVLTGVGQMAAKSLLHYVVRRGLYLESIYLSALIACALRAEMHSFTGPGAAAVLMEAAARHRRLVDAVREWLRTSPKLYHRDLPLFYEWEDAVKDFAITHTEKAEGFRLSI